MTLHTHAVQKSKPEGKLNLLHQSPARGTIGHPHTRLPRISCVSNLSRRRHRQRVQHHTLSVSGWVLHGSICCLSNGSHGLAEWSKAVMAVALARQSKTHSKLQACSQAAERAQCAGFGSSDLAASSLLLTPRACRTQEHAVRSARTSAALARASTPLRPVTPDLGQTRDTWQVR